MRSGFLRLGILFSGGKDSTLALHMAAQIETIACLITLLSENKESYMFHTPNIDLTTLQAEALQLPLVTRVTEGRKEEELHDLEQAIVEAVRQFHIEGVVTGAVESVYQSTRIQRICHRLNLWCLNPLWKRNQKELLEELLVKRFRVIVSGVFAYPLDETWVGKELSSDMIAKLMYLHDKFGISPSGEGGEIETTVLDAPMFKKKIEILNHATVARGNSGVFHVTEARLVPK
jgi:ABC transporter with metal-binding/Fe-S-binding domain ATP-binding protein